MTQQTTTARARGYPNEAVARPNERAGHPIAEVSKAGDRAGGPPGDHHTGRQATDDHDEGGHGERGGQREENLIDNPRMSRHVQRIEEALLTHRERA